MKSIQFHSTKNMVIDIREGMVDITAHHEDDGNIEVIVTPVGNNCSGTKVNQQFSYLLADIVDDPDFESFLSVVDHRKKSTTRPISIELYTMSLSNRN